MASPLSGTVAVSQIVDTAGPGQPFYAPASGGGGGGGGGPNLSVSSITLNPTGNGVILATGAGNTQSQIVWNTSVDGTESFQAFWRNGQSGDVVRNNKSLAFTTWSTSTDIGTAPIDCLAINLKPQNGVSPSGVIADNGQGGIYLTGVSSINGQVPGTGGGGPNLNVSTITLPANGAIQFNGTPGYINFTSTLIFDDVATGGQDFRLYSQIGSGAISPALPPNDIGSFIVQNAPGGQSGCGFGQTTSSLGFFVNSDKNGNPAPFAIVANEVQFLGVGTLDANLSDLKISSINGASPGGGGGAPPAVVSTISSLVNVSTINSGSPGILNVLGGMVVSDNIGTGSISTLRIDSIAPGGSVSIPLAILSTVSGDVNISTLTVSSVNGAPYPPASGGSVFSSINIPGGPGSAFNADPNQILQILSIPIIPNHVYSVDVNARVIANNAPNVSATDNYYLELVANGGPTQALNTAWGVQVSTLTSGAVYTEVGGTAIFKAPANPVSTLLLNALGTFSTTTRVDSFSYIDFGAI